MLAQKKITSWSSIIGQTGPTRFNQSHFKKIHIGKTTEINKKDKPWQNTRCSTHLPSSSPARPRTFHKAFVRVARRCCERRRKARKRSCWPSAKPHRGKCWKMVKGLNLVQWPERVCWRFVWIFANIFWFSGIRGSFCVFVSSWPLRRLFRQCLSRGRSTRWDQRSPEELTSWSVCVGQVYGMVNDVSLLMVQHIPLSHYCIQFMMTKNTNRKKAISYSPWCLLCDQHRFGDVGQHSGLEELALAKTSRKQAHAGFMAQRRVTFKGDKWS